MNAEQRAEKIYEIYDKNFGVTFDKTLCEMIAAEIKAAVEEAHHAEPLCQHCIDKGKTEAYEEVRRFLDEKLNNANK